MTKIILIKNKMLTVPAIAPAYMAKFQCIGPECQDHCCRKWNVYIDKTHYQFLRNQVPEAVRQAAVASLKPYTKSTGDADFAYIDFKGEDGTCAMLNEEKLCKIHAEVGAEALPDVCYIYPRSQWQCKDTWRESAQLSCPAAARLCLTDPDAMSFVEKTVISRASTMRVRPGSASADAYIALNTFFINLFQFREYPFWQRMALMVLCCTEADRLIVNEQAEQLETFLENFSAAILSGECRQWFEPLVPDLTKKVEVAIPMFQSGLGRHLALQYDKVIELFGLGYGITEPLDPKRIEITYQAIWRLKLQPFLEQHPYFLENWILNHLFTTGFPIGIDQSSFPFSQRTPFIAGCEPIIVKYVMLMFLLGGMAVAQDDAFNIEQAVWAVQVIEKSHEHNEAFRSRMTLDVDREQGMLTLLAEPSARL